jgi:predicted nucleic acid-binding protein
MPDNSFLIDTSAWLFALKRDFVPEVKNRIDLLLKNHVVVTTGIINLEIISGAKTKKEFQRLRDRFNALDMVESIETMWQKACELGFNLRRKGVTVPHTDILIAACALQSGSIIVHADAHFDMMAKHAAIKVESFVKIVRDFSMGA